MYFDHIVNSISQLNQQLLVLKQAYLNEPYPSLESRLARLKSLQIGLLRAQHDFVDAVNLDFNGRTRFDSQIGDILPTINGLKYQIKHLAQWMKADKRRSGLTLWPSKVWVQQVPKGVIGVIAPWNYPIQLALLPVITALAAGNRVMLKLSEFTPHVNQQIKLLLRDVSDFCVVVEGDHEVAAEFSALSFDHLFFTGATEIGRKVMSAAAKNLVPVTLELGGKSPVIVTDDADIEHCAKSVLLGKLTNAGQLCVAPDYVLVTKNRKAAFYKALQEVYLSHFSERENDEKITSIINDKQFARLRYLLEDAQQLGARIWPAVNYETNQQGACRMGLHIIDNTNSDMQVLKSEIFGPILPIVEVDNLDSAINFVTASATPLACYVFTQDNEVKKRLSQSLRCGSLAINDTVLQVTAEDLPFGGVGASGIGQYHGKEGFLTFSHGKSVLESDSKVKLRTTLLLKQSNWLLKPLKAIFLK